MSIPPPPVFEDS